MWRIYNIVYPVKIIYIQKHKRKLSPNFKERWDKMWIDECKYIHTCMKDANTEEKNDSITFKIIKQTNYKEHLWQIFYMDTKRNSQLISANNN